MLTRKQLNLLNFIRSHLQEHGYPPNFDEMAIALNIKSKSGIHRYIIALEERGFIRRLAYRSRAIEVIKLPETLVENTKVNFQPSVIDKGNIQPLKEKTTNTIPSHTPRPVNTCSQDVPMMGRIAAGAPTDAISEIWHDISVPGFMIESGYNHYALEIQGDSMIDAGINDGDTVVIAKTSSAKNGDIVVAMIKDYEATLKKFYHRGSKIELRAANSAYDSKFLPAHQVEIQGRLVGLMRTY
ncbi:MAG: transcriptional repressor LexA [Aestuariivita sp.]|nr:transcriptional repressor LexA [Aestuariivita sp.]